jgi:hypothetical protein
MIALLSTDSLFFTWVILPVLIFLSRIADVLLGTVRLIFVSRGIFPIRRAWHQFSFLSIVRPFRRL